MVTHERAVPITIFEPGGDEVCKRYDADLALIAPDGHVVWRGNGLPADCGALIDRVRGA